MKDKIKYVVIRDDDTNALMPEAYLERLYRPFLDRGLPVNLATIPNVSSDLKLPDGRPEWFLIAKNGHVEKNVPIGSNAKLVQYLLANPGYKILQHGYQHFFHEFRSDDRSQIVSGLEEGGRLLQEAGFPSPTTFVAPQDRLSRVGMMEVSKRFKVISTCWFESRQMSLTWWPGYLCKKILKKPHWKVGQTKLLSHDGSLLTHTQPYDSILAKIKERVARQKLTVLVTHWWEYFRDQKPDERLIEVLHQTAAYLADDPEIRVVSFDDIAEGKVPLD